MELCERSDAVLLGAIGGPKWDNLPVELRPEAGALLPLRKELALYANLRPCIVFPSLMHASTLKKRFCRGGYSGHPGVDRRPVLWRKAGKKPLMAKRQPMCSPIPLMKLSVLPFAFDAARQRQKTVFGG